ncbi:MAG: murein biosynthesis integral membrane protein MurJ [bacterium]
MSFNGFFNSQAKTVSSAAGILAVSFLISRLLGVVRNWLLARNFGAGSELDVYFAVFRIPDFIYQILISGGIIVAFLPLFSEFFSRDKEAAWRFTSNVLNVFLFFLVLLSLFLFIFTPGLIKLITPGFTDSQLKEAVFLSRLMFLSPILFGLSSIFSGVLQYFNRFLIYSLTPVLYNLGIILGILFLAPKFGVMGIIIGVLLGAFLHLAIQIPSAISCGFRYQKIFNFKEPGLKKVFLLMLPRTLGVAGGQINLIVMTAIASVLGAGSISIFALTNDLQNVPIGIIGVSFATALFAPLSRRWANGEKEEFLKDFSSGFRQVAYIIFPIVVLIFILRNQIVEIVLRHGEFSQVSAQLVSASLGLFCFSIWAISFVPLLSRVFFSLQDTRTPTAVVFSAIILNIILSFYFIGILSSAGFLHNLLQNWFFLKNIGDIRVLGLPLAFTLSGIFQFVLLMVFLYKKIGDFRLKEIGSSALKIIPAAFLMGTVSFLSLPLASSFLSDSFWSLLLAMFVAVLVGVPVYFFTTSLFKSPEAKAIKLKIISRFIHG